MGKRDYLVEFLKRESVIREMLSLGLPKDVIARFVGVCIQTVQTDISRIEGMGGVPVCMKFSSRGDRYAHVLQNSAELLLDEEERKGVVATACRHYLFLDDLVERLDGVVDIFKHLTLRQVPDNRKGYMRFLEKLFVNTRSLNSVWYDSGCEVVGAYLLDVCKKNVSPATSFENVYNVLLARVASLYRPHVLPSWSESMEKEIDRALDVLSEREAFVVCRRCGIRCGVTTLEETALILGVTSERVRQIENKAFRMLRESYHYTDLRICFAPIDQIVADEFERRFVERKHRLVLQKAVEFDEVDETPSTEFNDALFLSIDGLGLSVRAKNGLNVVGIYLIGQLVQKSGSYLLKIRNFGQKSLKEIRQQLRAYRLTLDMDLPGGLKETIRKESERQFPDSIRYRY